MASLDDLRDSADDYFAYTQRRLGQGIYGVSVCSKPDMTAAEILGSLPNEHRLPNRRIRQSTAGRLRNVGFDVLLTGWSGHATLTFPGAPSDEDWEKLQAMFDPPEPNPFPRED